MASAVEEIRKMWSIFPVGEDNPLSLRAIRAKHLGGRVINYSFTAGEFPNIEDRKKAFEAEALRLNAASYNVYIVMNPIRPGFCGTAVCDSDIESRALLLIDLDRAVKADAPATDAEIEDAASLGDQVAAYLKGYGWDDPIRVMSGNGIHLYYRLDGLPNDEGSKELVGQLLRSLAAKFNNASTHIDTSVFNASRITKVPGTIARKGVEAKERPYQMAQVVE